MNSTIVLYYNKILKKGIIISTSYVYLLPRAILNISCSFLLSSRSF